MPGWPWRAILKHLSRGNCPTDDLAVFTINMQPGVTPVSKIKPSLLFKCNINSRKNDVIGNNYSAYTNEFNLTAKLKLRSTILKNKTISPYNEIEKKSHKF